MKVVDINKNDLSNDTKEYQVDDKEWSSYSSNYVDGVSSNGFKVSASMSAARFGSKFVEYSKNKEI